MLKKILTAVLFYGVAAPAVPGQQVPQSSQKTNQSIEVVRVSADLVQTDVTVFDKSGHFVDGLERDQFELRVDGKPQTISFFDRLIAGSEKEARQVPARGNKTAVTDLPQASGNDLARTIIFFIDDLHLSADSVQRTRQTILRFIDREMGAIDQVAIASASGQIGFLQQFTDNKQVLRAAIARLSHHPYTVVDAENITMSEYSALKVEQGDRDAIDYFTSQLLKATTFSSRGGVIGPPGGGPAASSAGINVGRPTSGPGRQSAELMVKQRAQSMLKQAATITGNTLAGLQSLMRSSAQYSGRKLVFFLSDGFYLNDRTTGFANKLHEITDAAIRAGVVIYSLDARGLTNFTDTTNNRSDPEGRLGRSNIGELAASQDALNALAEDTGGRALLNYDAIGDGISRALNETSHYYLLAWRPTTEEQKAGNFKQIQVSIVARPDLAVRFPKGYLAVARMATENAGETVSGSPKPAPVATKSVENELGSALLAFAPRRSLPTGVSASFLDTPNNGPILNASVEAATAGLDYGADGKQIAAIDVAGVVLNDQGKTAASFKTRLTVAPLPTTIAGTEAGVVYTYKVPLKPGLYQVRAAAREEKTGKLGSGMQWVEIPDLSGRHLTLSSLLLGIGLSDKKSAGVNSTPQVQFRVYNRFTHASQLSFWLFIYNATRANSGPSAPDLTAQIQVFRNKQTVVSTPPRKLNTDGMSDLARIPYGGQFPLASLTIGRYDLQVTILDRLANTTATQRASFQIE